MKIPSIILAFIAVVPAALANIAPTPVIVSATMRDNSTYMDIVYRVNDPDDATVKVRALAFVDGVRSLAKVLRPVTFVEGTAANLGDAIAANTNQTLTWDVGADWNIDLGQVKFEVLAMDERGLLPFDWISIPAAGGQPALTISKDTPSNQAVFDAFLWLYASGDPWLTLSGGTLSGTPASGAYAGLSLVSSNVLSTNTNTAPLQRYSRPFIFKRMNLDPAGTNEVSYAAVSARAGLLNTTNWHAVNRAYAERGGLQRQMTSWGTTNYGLVNIPAGLTNVTAVAAGSMNNLALKSDGTVVVWGYTNALLTNIPAGLTNVAAIALGGTNSLALKSNGTVVCWGAANYGLTNIPAGLSNVTAIAAGLGHALALKSNGTVVCWGATNYGLTNIPAGLSNVTAIAAGAWHALALRSDGTVVCWGYTNYGLTNIPAGLSNVTAISAGYYHNLALKSNGTVVCWGYTNYALTNIPAGLSNVTAISAGYYHNLALKSDGMVVGWGRTNYGLTNIPAGLSNVTAISAGNMNNLAIYGAKEVLP